MTDDVGRRSRLAQMSELYYVERWTQVAIAERFGVSAMQVSRLLREAQRLGIVEFRINHPLSVDSAPARELQERYGLRSVVAVRATGPDQVKADVARASAHHLVSLLESKRTLAVAWSSTLALLAHALPHRPFEDLTVVQMLGALTPLVDRYNPYDAFVRIGTQLGARMHPVHAPTVLRSRQARDALIEDPAVKSVLDIARAAEFAICGIGTVGSDSTFYRLGYLPRQELDALRNQGVVGDMLGRFLDAHGREVPWSLSDMLLALNLEELKRIPQVIAVAAGPSKVHPILAALRGGYLAHLVTDAETVRTLLEMGDEAVGS